MRLLFNMEELTTDNAICAWDDPYLQPLHNLNIVSNNVYIAAMYDRSFFQITVANDFIRNSTDAMIASRGFNAAASGYYPPVPGRSAVPAGLSILCADGPFWQPGICHRK